MIGLIVGLIVLGLCLYLISLIPMDPTMLQIIRVVVIIVAILWVISSLGLFGGGPIFGASHHSILR